MLCALTGCRSTCRANDPVSVDRHRAAAAAIAAIATGRGNRVAAIAIAAVAARAQGEERRGT